MRLLLVTHYYPDHRGGIEIVAGELARRLAKQGFSITWAASALSSPNPAGEPIAGLRLAPMRAWNFAEKRLGFPYPLWSPSSLRKLSALVASSDIVHLHDSLYLGNFITARLAKRFGKPLVVTQHIGEVPYRSPILRSLLRIANRTLGLRVMSGADQCIFISPRVRDHFRKFVRFRAPPLYLPNGVDTDLFRPAQEKERGEIRRRLGWPDRPALLFVGRFVEKKGLIVLRECAQRLPECSFIFAGWGPIDPRSWGLSNVICAGSLSAKELVPYYQLADLLVLPSVGEGFPLVTQEAAACGTPALISRETAEGHADINEFAFVSEPIAAEVVARIRMLLAQPDEMKCRGQRAVAFAKKQWHWEAVTESYIGIFKRLIASNGA